MTGNHKKNKLVIWTLEFLVFEIIVVHPFKKIEENIKRFTKEVEIYFNN